MTTLVIRRQQMRVLEDDAQKRLIAAHIERHFPETCQGRTRKAWISAIDKAIERARSYGFHTHRDLEQYVVLAMTLGEHFEDRSEFAWTRDILHDSHPARVPFRATWLYERVTEQLAG